MYLRLINDWKYVNAKYVYRIPQANYLKISQPSVLALSSYCTVLGCSDACNLKLLGEGGGGAYRYFRSFSPLSIVQPIFFGRIVRNTASVNPGLPCRPQVLFRVREHLETCLSAPAVSAFQVKTHVTGDAEHLPCSFRLRGSGTRKKKTRTRVNKTRRRKLFSRELLPSGERSRRTNRTSLK